MLVVSSIDKMLSNSSLPKVKSVAAQAKKVSSGGRGGKNESESFFP